MTFMIGILEIAEIACASDRECLEEDLVLRGTSLLSEATREREVERVLRGEGSIVLWVP